MILNNANIITLDPQVPEARWVAIENERFVAIGHGNDWKNIENADSRLIDCRGKTILPGFIDAHLHLVSYAKSFVTLDLSPHSSVLSISDLQATIRNYSLNRSSGQWILGKGYNEFYFTDRRHPNRHDLDSATPDHPIRLTHRSGHIHVLNSLALKLVRITRETGDPDGAIIERDLKTGEPTGLLYEMGDFLSERIPSPSHTELEKGLQKANQELISLGITSIHDASSRNGKEQFNRFTSWKESGILLPRVNMMLGTHAFRKNKTQLPLSNLSQNQLRLGAVKIILDDTTGRLHPCRPELNEMVFEAHRSGAQVAIHALEEKAIKAAYRAIQYALEKVPSTDHRHRIEHCAVCPPDLARKIASLGITVVTQPAFIYFHGERYRQTVSDAQLKHLYPIGTLLDHGINVAAGSDCPVVPPDPLTGMLAAMHRMSEKGDLVGVRERIQSTAALKMYTLNAARTAFEETLKGTITPGKLADLVVLSADPTMLQPKEFKNLQVEMTVIGGAVVWEKNR